MRVGTSTTSTQQDAGTQPAQDARNSSKPGLPGSVDIAPSAPSVGADSQVGGKSDACYCENRECNCTPEIVERIETIFTPEPVSDQDWPVVPFVTPLMYDTAIDLVDVVLAESLGSSQYLSPKFIVLRDRLAHLLMTVDCESRKQGYVITGEERQ